jgi:hypothetical protein
MSATHKPISPAGKVTRDPIRRLQCRLGSDAENVED